MQQAHTGEVVAVLGLRYPDLEVEEAVLRPAGARLRRAAGTSRAEIIEAAADAAVIIAGSGPRFDRETLQALRCRGIVRAGVGTDTVDLEAAAREGIVVANVPDYGTDAVACHTLALILACARGLPAADRAVRAGRWGLADLRPLHLPAALTAGVVGYGRIGRRVAELLAGVGFRVLAHDPVAQVGPPATPASLEDLLGRADVVSLHAPAAPSGRPLLGPAELARMRPGSVLVNTSRGRAVDLAALVDGLARGRPRFAALDVFPTEPPDLAPLRPVADRLLLTPHMAWYTEETEAALRRGSAEEARRILLGEPPRHPVVLPERKRGAR